MVDNYRKLSRDELIDLADIFNRMFRESRLPAGGLPEMWYRVVSDFQKHKYEGAELVLRKVRDRELRVLQSKELSREYISLLMGIMGINGIQLSEEQKLVYMMTATSDERDEALLSLAVEKD